MKRYLKILGLGFLVWLLPFIISFFVFPTKAMFAPLFETIMAIVVAATGVVFTIIGFPGVDGETSFRLAAIFGIVYAIVQPWAKARESKTGHRPLG